MTKRLEEEILLKVPKKNGPSLTRLLMPGAGRKAAAAVSPEVQLPTADTIQAAKQVGDRRARAVLEGLSPDLTDEELDALEASVEARKERVSIMTEAVHQRIDRLVATEKSGRGDAEKK